MGWQDVEKIYVIANSSELTTCESARSEWSKVNITITNRKYTEIKHSKLHINLQLFHYKTKKQKLPVIMQELVEFACSSN